jgi:hypothetical protein
MKCPKCDGTGDIADYPDWVEDSICDGCAQSFDECLCGIDIEDVRNCDSIFHPGCNLCEMRDNQESD